MVDLYEKKFIALTVHTLCYVLNYFVDFFLFVPILTERDIHHLALEEAESHESLPINSQVSRLLEVDSYKRTVCTA